VRDQAASGDCLIVLDIRSNKARKFRTRRCGPHTNRFRQGSRHDPRRAQTGLGCRIREGMQCMGCGPTAVSQGRAACAKAIFRSGAPDAAKSSLAGATCPHRWVAGHRHIRLWLPRREAAVETAGMKPPPDPHHRHRVPADIVSHVVWLYHLSSLSLRGVELLLAERGVPVSYGTVRHWCGDSFIYGHSHPRRHLMSASHYRKIRARAFRLGRLETCAQCDE
jgi:hypothetical protein